MARLGQQRQLTKTSTLVVGVIVHLARLDVNRLVGTLNRAAATIVAELAKLP